MELEILGGRVTPEVRPTSKFPAVVYARRSASDPDVLGEPTFQFATIDVVVIAKNYDELQAAVDAVNDHMNDKQGEWGGVGVELCIESEGSNADDDIVSISDTSGNVHFCLTTLTYDITSEA